jgi:hypothetical protein
MDRRSLVLTLLPLLLPGVLPGAARAQFTVPSVPQGLPQGLPQGVPGSGGPAQGGRGAGLSQGEIGTGLKDALRVGSEKVIGQLGRRDGFWGNPEAKIGLPSWIRPAQSALRSTGYGASLDDLELRMNRGAEAAVPKAKQLFLGAISGITFDDARRILQGPEDSATRYLREKTGVPLTRDMTPIVDRELQGSGAQTAYRGVADRARALPVVGSQVGQGSLTDWVTGEAMNTLFRFMGREEAAIRRNPAARTTDAMRKVFG